MRHSALDVGYCALESAYPVIISIKQVRTQGGGGQGVMTPSKTSQRPRGAAGKLGNSPQQIGETSAVNPTPPLPPEKCLRTRLLLNVN